MIIPLSITFSEDFGHLRKVLCETGAAWFSSYDNIPAAVFAGVSQRCTIWIGAKKDRGIFMSPMYRWRSVTRPYLVQNVGYAGSALNKPDSFGLPKFPSASAIAIINAIDSSTPNIRDSLVAGRAAGVRLGFAPAARNFVSVFKNVPPCLDAEDLSSAETSDAGSIGLCSTDDAFSALAALSGELYFWYWLIHGDGFHMTSTNIKGFVHCLNQMQDRHFSLLSCLGQLLDARRLEALVFKKNAGKYVGNFNYRGHFQITRRADLLTMAGLGIGRSEALEVFDHVQRVLAINESAGEKSIPDEVKRKFRPKPIDVNEQRELFRKVDALISQHYRFTPGELDFIVNHDVKYPPDPSDETDDTSDE